MTVRDKAPASRLGNPVLGTRQLDSLQPAIWAENGFARIQRRERLRRRLEAALTLVPAGIGYLETA